MTKPHDVAGRLHLRSANGVDFDYCASLYFEGMANAIRELNLDPDLQMTNFRQRWAVEEARIIVRDRANVGWLQSRIEGQSVFLAQLFVESSCQRQGIGTQVVKCIIAEAAHASRSVTLGVVRTNPALRLYERLGFRITHEDGRKFYMRRD